MGTYWWKDEDGEQVRFATTGADTQAHLGTHCFQLSVIPKTILNKERKVSQSQKEAGPKAKPSQEAVTALSEEYDRGI